MRKTTLTIGTLHFVGIGGIGMSGIAELLHALGYTVQGSDISDNANVKRLRKKGISVSIGHDASHIEGAGAIVVSSAIKRDNPELVAARAAKIPVVKRADMLAELMRFKTAIAVGGTHGKTTTTSIIGTLLEEGGLDPTVVNGGIIHAYGTNTRLGESEWMVVESDESDGTFTRLPATIAVVTNIDPEHMEHYGDFEAVKHAYRQFVENIPFYGFAVLCLDHPEVQALLPQITDRRVITYGMSAQAQVRATHLRTSPTGTTFDVTIAGDTWSDCFFPMPGAHNVQNALSAIAIGHELGLSETQIKKALRTFQGVKRRFTKTGEAGGITIIDDYGHHPVEITAVLKAARQMVEGTSGRIIAVAQPHRYSRLSDLMSEFATCFNEADTVIVADVYAAGETPIEGVSAESLVECLGESGHHDARYLEGGADQLPAMIADIAHEGDFVICLGAGDITAWAAALPEALETYMPTKGRNAL